MPGTVSRIEIMQIRLSLTCPIRVIQLCGNAELRMQLRKVTKFSTNCCKNCGKLTVMEIGELIVLFISPATKLMTAMRRLNTVVSKQSKTPQREPKTGTGPEGATLFMRVQIVCSKDCILADGKDDKTPVAVPASVVTVESKDVIKVVRFEKIERRLRTVLKSAIEKILIIIIINR